MSIEFDAKSFSPTKLFDNNLINKTYVIGNKKRFGYFATGYEAFSEGDKCEFVF